MNCSRISPVKVGDLVKDVRNGRIGLPDLQRPFVWKDNKVRELFDSMLKGYPIGYIMLWESPADYESKKSAIGDNSKTYEEPKELVIDGQQRLTALVAAMYAVKVKDKNFADREIKISYNPLTREFAVWSQAYEKDTEWISRISDVFLAKEDNSISSLRRHFIKEANEGRGKKELPLLTDEEEDRIEDNINALLNLSDYSLPTLEISYTADEEDVADIFVRVNSGGQSLTENNFIQTLISVYENETSNKINAFAAASRVPAANTSYNTLLAIEPSHLIRMAVGVGFKRARLRYAYMLLRGKNLETGKFSDEVRHENLQIFKDALDKVMNLNNWHSFINIVAEAGYISDKLIASSNAIVFSYVLYLNAKYDYKLDAAQLKKCTSKWFFMSTITYFYTGSTESEVEKQFADLRDVHTAAEFIAYIDRVIETHFTDDYFSLTLPNELNSAAAISPAWYGYVAAQIVLNTPIVAVVDAVIAKGSEAAKDFIAEFTGIATDDQVLKALQMACELQLIVFDSSRGCYGSPSFLARKLVSASSDEQKAVFMRLILEQYAPYNTFKTRYGFTKSIELACRQTKTLHMMTSNERDVKNTLISIATYAKALKSEGANLYSFVEDVDAVGIIEAALRSANITENSLRTYWGENLYTFVNTSNVFAPLIEALQKTHSGTMDVRSIVVCAANAFESFLADFAVRKGVSLSGRNGILQKRDALSAHISKKHRGMIEFVGQVRNAADHGADPDENNQVWTISNETARIYPCIIAALIKAIFSRDATGSIEV